MNNFKSKIAKRVLSIVLALIMVVSIVPVNPVMAAGTEAKEQKEVTISVENGAGGIVKLNGEIKDSLTVTEGDTVSLEIQPNEGFGISSITIGEEIVDEFEKSNFKRDITAENDITIKAEYEELVYSVNVDCGEEAHGTAVLSNGKTSDQSTYKGSNVVTITPEYGYTVDTITLNEKDVKSLLKQISDTELQLELTDITVDTNVKLSFIKCEAAAETDFNISRGGLVKEDDNNIYIYEKGGKAIIKTDKQGIKVKYSDNSEEGSYESVEIEIDKTKNIVEVWLYYDMGWHRVEEITKDQPVKIVVDNEECDISITADKANENGFYGTEYIENGINADIKVNEQLSGDTYSGIKEVSYEIRKYEDDKSDSYDVTEKKVLYEYGKTDSNLKQEYTDKINIKPEENNSDKVELYVKTVDNSGNESTKSIWLKINVDEPKVTITFDNNDVKYTDGSRGYYQTARKATVQIEDRASAYDADAVKAGIVIQKDGGSYTPVTENWKDEGNIHTFDILFDKDGNYNWSFTYTNKAGNAGGVPDTKESTAPYEFTVDTTKPDGKMKINADDIASPYEIIESIKEVPWSFGSDRWKNCVVNITAEISDKTSPVFPVKYYKQVNSSNNNILTISELDALYNSNKFQDSAEGAPNEQFVIYARIADYAGNVKYIASNGVILDEKECSINMTPEAANANGFYGTKYIADGINVGVSIEDPLAGGTYSGIGSVSYEIRKYDDESETYNVTKKDILYKYEDGSERKQDYTGNITVKPEENNSDRVEVSVTAVDNAGNENTQSIWLKINVDKPKVTITFDNNDVKYTDGKRGYYSASRKATVQIEDRESAYDADAAKKGIKIQNGENEYTPVIENQKDEGNIHTFDILFAEDGNYSFSFAYTSKADNANSETNIGVSTTPYEFTVDTKKPEGTINVDENLWKKLIEKLTFGIYKNSDYEVTGTASDATSPLFPIQYYKTDKTEAMKETELDNLADTEWKEFGDGFKVSANERFTVYLKITDYAGNYTYISSDGAIADNTPCNISLTPEQANENGVYGLSYNEGINVDVHVEDPETGRTYSGIKSIDYKVVKYEENEKVAETVEDYKSISPDIVTQGQGKDNDKLFEYDETSPTYEELRHEWKGNIIVKPELNDSSNVYVYVHVTDNAGNESVTSVKLDIDVTRPEITVSYDNNKDNNGNGYFNAERKATIVIKERTGHFDGAKAKNTDPAINDGIKIKAVDVKGEAVSGLNINSMISDWITSEGKQANNNDATHTITISYSADANYTFAISYTDEAGNANSGVTVAEGSIAPYEFTVDKTKPEGTINIDKNSWKKLIEKLTFGIYKNSDYEVKGTALDVTSPLFPVQYYKTDSVTALTVDELEAIQADSWQEFGDGFSVLPNERFTVYLKITDWAGNYTYVSSDGAIADNTPCNITLAPEPANENGVYGLSYSEGINVDVHVEDPEDGGTYSGIKSVKYKVVKDATDENDVSAEKVTQGNGNEGILFEYDNMSPEYKELINKWEGTKENGKSITVDPKLNDSSNVYVHVYVTDNAGNESSSWIKLDIDVTVPEITVSYDNNKDNNGNGYFNADRTATIKIKERTNHFNRAKAKNTDPVIKDGIKITAVDVSGNVVNGLDVSSMISEWTTSEGKQANNNDATHTITITYSADANYTFAISYTDEAGNANNGVTVAKGSIAPYKFTVDKTQPYGTVSIDKNTWDKLIEKLTFGLYKNSDYEVTGTASDATSPLFAVQYYKTAFQQAMTETELDGLADDNWDEFGNGFSVSPDERFTVYLKITDYAGNYKYISSDGAIADKTVCNITLVPEAANENGVYGLSYSGGINVDVSVEDPENGGTYSGIKSVTYKIVKDAKDDNDVASEKVTQEGTLFEYNKTSPTYEELQHEWKGNITVKPELNDSSNVYVHVYVTDNTGNESSQAVKLDIDVTKPEITVSYDNNKDNNGNGYFNEERTATIEIKERTNHFNGAKAKNTDLTIKDGIKITAVDVKGNAVNGLNVSNMISEWTTFEGKQANNNDAMHAAVINYSLDANYTFAISYTDEAGNTNEEVMVKEGTKSPYKFTVDKTVPYGTVKAKSAEGRKNDGNWNNLRSSLTYGFWSKKGIDISGTSGDATSPVYVQYYKQVSTNASDETTVLTKEQLDAITDWKDFGNGFDIKTEEQFVVYLKITDSAGNYIYISTDGLIVDKNAPIYEAIAPEIIVNPVQSKNGLYNDDVKVSIKVTDPLKGGTYSGLKEVSYEVYDRASSKTEPTQKGVLYSFNNKNPLQSELKHTWSGKIKVDSKKNNSNDVRIVVYATDNSDNSSNKYTTIKIDTTPPVINVSYDNNNADSKRVFKDDRTATIAISERNFNPEDVSIKITNTDGVIPKVSSWKRSKGTGNKDNTVWRATIRYSKDGDYTFAVDYTDLANNKCKGTNYVSGTVAGKKFTIDKIDPVIKVSYDNNAVKHNNYYKANRTATIVITEHNFDAGRVNIKLTATDDGKAVQIPQTSNWTTNGDKHTATISYTKDALYTFDISFKDKAGRKAANYSKQSFYVDKTKPTLEITGVKNNSANNGDVIPVISYSDTNCDVSAVNITLTGVNRGRIDQLKGSYEDIHNGKRFTFDNFDKDEAVDDIYTLSATLTDRAGNKTTKSIRFSVNRFGSTYSLDKSTKDLNGSYVKEPKDLIITEINADALNNIKVILFKNNNSVTLEEGKDYKIDVTGGNGEWYSYTYTIFKDNFIEDAVYRLNIHSQDSSGNIAENTLDTKKMDINFGVDKTLPVVNVKNLESKKTYALENLTVQMSASDNLKLESVIVYLDEKECKNWNGEELEKLIENGNDFEFDIPGNQTSAHNVRVEAMDAAGNQYIENIEGFYVTTNLWVRYYNNKPLFFGSIAGIIIIIAGIVILIVMKNRRKEKEQL